MLGINYVFILHKYELCLENIAAFYVSREPPLLSRYNRCNNSERTLLRIHPFILHGAGGQYHILSVFHLPICLRLFCLFPYLKLPLKGRFQMRLSWWQVGQLMVIRNDNFIHCYLKWKVRLDKYVRSSIGTKGLKRHCSF